MQHTKTFEDLDAVLPDTQAEKALLDAHKEVLHFERHLCPQHNKT